MDAEPRTIVVRTNLSTAEFVEFAQWADSLGLSQSAAIRMVIKRALAASPAQVPNMAKFGPSVEP